jgi:glycosyltransferase involved in cell wall biosynthesis
MRIGFNGRGLRDPLLRGFNRYTWSLLQELQTRPGVDLSVYTDHRSPVHPFFRERLRARIVETRASTVVWWEQAVLPWQLRHDRIDVFHAPAEGGLPSVRACPYVLTYHGVPGPAITNRVRSGELEGPRSRFLDGEAARSPRALLTDARSAALRRLYLRAADHVITVSELSRSEIVRFLKIAPERVSVTHEAAADAFRAPVAAGAGADVGQKYGLPPEFLLFVGGFNRHKNVETLLRVFAALKAERPGLGLVLVGGRDAEIASTRASLGLGRDVLSLLHIPDEDLRAIYAHAALFVTLSWHEGFCLPVVEAMSCGVPVVASRCGAIPEVLGGGGILVDPRRPGEVVDAVRSVLETPALRARLREQALERSRSFSWTHTADQTLAIYERLLAANRSAA